MVRLPLVIHIIAGSVGIITGFVALYSAKGARLHRRAGMLFVYAMLTMAFLGVAIAAAKGGVGSMIGGLFTAYLVTTGLTTMRPLAAGAHQADIGLMLAAFALTAFSLSIGVEALASPKGKMYGLPPFPYLMFATVGLLASIGDVRMIRSGPLRGAPRLVRHLWRMCWALWIAASSFFLGQSQVIPKPIRIIPVLAFPLLAIVVTMLYWLWRVRVRRFVPRVTRVSEAA
jgi:hypothetical protein